MVGLVTIVVEATEVRKPTQHARRAGSILHCCDRTRRVLELTGETLKLKPDRMSQLYHLRHGKYLKLGIIDVI